jgi:hypothetical protein
LPTPLQRNPHQVQDEANNKVILGRLDPGVILVTNLDGILTPVSSNTDVLVSQRRDDTTGATVTRLLAVGLNGIPISRALPADGAHMVYNAAKNIWQYSETSVSGSFLSSAFSNGFN